MRTSDPDIKNYKKVRNNLPNIAIPTKNAIPGEVQLTFTNTSVGKKSLRESVAEFALAGSIDSPSVVSIDINIAFTINGKKIRHPIPEVLLHAAAGDLMRLNNQRYWTLRSTVLLPPFLTEAEILNM